jgi:hypothetical protein
MKIKEHTITIQEVTYLLGMLVMTLIYFYIDQPIP